MNAIKGSWLLTKERVFGLSGFVLACLLEIGYY